MYTYIHMCVCNKMSVEILRQARGAAGDPLRMDRCEGMGGLVFFGALEAGGWKRWSGTIQKRRRTTVGDAIFIYST